MKRVIMEYSCDVCKKHVKDEKSLTRVKIPTPHWVASDFQGLGQFSKMPYIHSLEICNDCLKAMSEILNREFADIYSQDYVNGVTVKRIKYRNNSR